VSIREKYTPVILELAHQSAETGNPIICSMEYYFPNKGFEKVIDQFMLGENILVAPMVNGENSRQVILPKGKWVGDDGKTYKGGKTYSIVVPLDRIPVFTLAK